MAIKRQLNVLGQQRIDAPHLRMMESAVAADFDALAGEVMAGGQALIVKGFALSTSQMTGQPASSLQVVVAGSALIHPLATEAGSVFTVPDSTANEQLSISNAKVEGSFTASATNYVGIDLRREADETTADTVTFLDAVTWQETPRLVPLARVLNYRFLISTTDFSATPHVCPIAIVTTTSTNTISAIVDARQMSYRLAAGGASVNNRNAFTWAQGRSVEAGTVDAAFTGGDRAIGSGKEWQDAIMTRLWELGGGERWFTANSDRDTKLCLGGTGLFPTGDNFRWTLGSSLIEWTSLYLVFANSTAVYNTITNGTATLADNQCLYVDVNRSTNATALTMQVANLATLGSPTIPGSRFIIAWRRGSEVFFRDKQYEAGRTFVAAATNASLGTVQLSYAVTGNPIVAARADTTGTISNTASAGNNSGFSGTGTGTGYGLLGTSSATSSLSAGVKGVGAGTGMGVHGIGIIGVYAQSSGGNAIFATGDGSGDAVTVTNTGFGVGLNAAGGPTNGIGIIGTAGGGNADGIQGNGSGTGVGVKATGGASGPAMLAVGGTGGGVRVQVSGTTAPSVGGQVEALQLRNTSTAVGTVVAMSLVHNDAADPPDGWFIRTNKLADGDVDLRFTTVTDGTLSDRLQYDSSANSLIFVGDTNSQINDVGAQMVRAQQLWINSALGAESSKIIAGGSLYFDGTTITLGRGAFRLADGTVFSSSADITVAVSTLGFAGNGQRYIYLNVSAGVGTLVGSTTAPNRNGHDGTTSRCYVGSVMVSGGSAANCRVVTTDFGVRYVSMANNNVGTTAFFGNTDLTVNTLSGGSTFNAYDTASNQAGASNLTAVLPTARTLYYNLSLFFSPNTSSPTTQVSLGLSSIQHGVVAMPIVIPLSTDWNRASPSVPSITNREITPFIFSTQLKLMNRVNSAVVFALSSVTGWHYTYTGALGAFEEYVNNPVNE